ncbi:hypothetical protein MATL_G00110030 [Megalops atlanticus]|uniref:Uncharacterized protein n=1 Tax=Megalops atlanticus TaxID=7932 RepID=A0A9D3Q518_MEGAT|nr:hypothetical protein MATL_G00110030 [Megalops atlanticus]
MADSCELSSILTNVNWTVYRSSSPEPPLLVPGMPLPVPTEHLVPLSSVYSSAGSEKWYNVAPQYWTRHHILEWIGYHVEESKFDATTLDLSRCSMDGPTLCQLSRDALVSMFHSLGERLFHNLLELKAKFGAGDLNMACDFFNSLFDEYPEILNVNGGDAHYDLLITDGRTDFTSYSQDGLKMEGDMTPVSDYGYESGRTSPGSLDNASTGTLIFQSPNSPDSLGSDSDLELSDLHSPQNTKVYIKTERGELGSCKRGRGRPKKLGHSSDHFQSKKSKHAPRGTHLWEFIRDILIHPEQYGGLMKWEDRRAGVFKFLKSEAVAQLWGQRKRNSSMTYEKLSRAMRYYYKREILERVDGRRLVYKFGKNASGWRLGELGVPA